MENTPIKKRPGFRVYDDRISKLPDSVISRILSFLPTKTVVATSILSTRWKFLWTKVTKLNFILDKDKEGEEGTIVRKFVLFVNKVLTHLTCQQLQRFRLEWSLGCQRDPENVSMWISYAISRRVRILLIDLGLQRNFVDIHLPGTLFTCATLEVLKLHVRFVLKVPVAVYLPKLYVMDIQHLNFESSHCLPKLISGCPVLTNLIISVDGRMTKMLEFRVSSPSLRHVVVCTVGGKLELDAPNLKFLSLMGVKDCLFKRRNSVDHVVFNPDSVSYTDMSRCNSIVRVLEAVNRVKLLTLHKSILRALSYATTPLSVCFERLARLEVIVECCHWSSLGAILSRSTRLQVLDIVKMGCGKNTDHKLCWNDPTEVPDCLSSTLRMVTFVGFSGVEDETEMIKYILQHGEVMESIVVNSAADPGDFKSKYKLLQDVAYFPRFSRTCKLQFD